ncbi:MAG: 23S rRNA (pseudouridine(1915)-N(3))-methyltransferase RlmH [Candidatus Aminicenantales bacterium]
MKYRILWPGKTKNQEIKRLQEFYLERINHLERCEIVQTKEARGIDERFARRIKEVEAEAIKRHLKDDYLICLSERGKEMSSVEFARFLGQLSSSSTRGVTFVLGGFLGLSEEMLKRADFILSLSRMTFSHEMSRIVLLEQIYRALTLLKGRQYAK